MALLFLTCCSAVPGTGAKAGGPAVTMISAGLVLTKMVGASAGLIGRAGMLLRTSAKFGSFGIALNAAGNLSIGL